MRKTISEVKPEMVIGFGLVVSRHDSRSVARLRESAKAVGARAVAKPSNRARTPEQMRLIHNERPRDCAVLYQESKSGLRRTADDPVSCRREAKSFKTADFAGK